MKSAQIPRIPVTAWSNVPAFLLDSVQRAVDRLRRDRTAMPKFEAYDIWQPGVVYQFDLIALMRARGERKRT